MHRDHHQCGDETLCSLIASELSPWRARQVRRHLAACPECQARFEEAKRLWSGLRNFDSAAVPGRVQLAFEQEVNASAISNPIQTDTLEKRKTMKKRLVLAGCAASALLATAAYASYRINKPTHPQSHGDNAFAWTMRVSSLATKRLVAEHSDSPPLGQSTTALAVMPPPAVMERSQAAGLVGVDDLTYGYSKPAQVTWAAQGKFKASMDCSDGTRLRDTSDVLPANTPPPAGSQIINHPALPNSDLPQLAVTTKGVTQTYAGYGHRLIHGANGIDVTLALEPVQSQKTAQLLQSLRFIDTAPSQESGQNASSSTVHGNNAPPINSGSLPNGPDMARLQAQMQALAANQKLQRLGANNNAAISRLKQQISQSILNSPEIKRLQSPEYQNQLRDQIDQQTLNSPEIKRLQSPEFQKNLRRQILNSPDMKYLQSPEFKKQLHDQLQAAQQQIDAATPPLSRHHP